MKGVLYYELLKLGETISAERYSNQLLFARENRGKTTVYWPRNVTGHTVAWQWRPHVALSTKQSSTWAEKSPFAAAYIHLILLLQITICLGLYSTHFLASVLQTSIISKIASTILSSLS